MGDGTLSWTQFYQEIQTLKLLSDQFQDGWEIIEKSPEDGDCYLLKKCKISIENPNKSIDDEFNEESMEEDLAATSPSQKDDIFEFEYHLLYHMSYMVPYISFNGYRSDGAILKLDEVWRLFNNPSMIKTPIKMSDILTQMEHPILFQPFMTIHPCRIADILSSFPKNKNRCLTVLSTFGPAIHLKMDLRYGKAVIHDNIEVLQETKKILNIHPGDAITSKLPLCVEISLKTVDGDAMILEVWSLGCLTDHNDPIVKLTHDIYNRMGVLLKSIITLTRSTPAYKLSRRQTADSYQIYYKIYIGDPVTSNLGEGFKQVRIGQLCTTVGTLIMAVAYRTKMTFSPTQTGRDNIIMKSDYFLKDNSPKHLRYHHQKKSEKTPIDLDKPLRPGAFFDPTKLKQFTEDDYVLPETPPFSWLLKKTKENESVVVPSDTESILTTSTSPSDSTITVTNSQNNNNLTFNNNNPDMGEKNESVIGRRTYLMGKSQSESDLGHADDKLLEELHFPFATVGNPMSDWAKFYRECYNAPPLHDTKTDDTNLDVLAKQLEQFETSLGDYDSLVTSLCCQSVDTNLNS